MLLYNVVRRGRSYSVAFLSCLQWPPGEANPRAGGPRGDFAPTVGARLRGWKETVAVLQTSVASRSRGQTGLTRLIVLGADKASRLKESCHRMELCSTTAGEQHPGARGVAMETCGSRVQALKTLTLYFSWRTQKPYSPLPLPCTMS